MNDISDPSALLGTSWGVVMLLLVVVAVLWLLLPFAVFGLKRRVDELIDEQRTTNVWLQEIAVQRAAANEEPAPPARERPAGRHISFEHNDDT